MSYSVTIGGVDRTSDVDAQTVHITDKINDQVDTIQFTMTNRSGLGAPSEEQEIIVVNSTGTTIFGGNITNIRITQIASNTIRYSCSGTDYTHLLDRNLVAKTYTNMTDAAIIADIVANFCGGSGITTNNVISSVTITNLVFNYLQPSQCILQLAKLSGQSWYIDYTKDIHYFPLMTTAAPLTIDLNTSSYWGLQMSKDSNMIKNRVYVRGGTYLSDVFTLSMKGDGVLRRFSLPDKPHSLTFAINGIAKSIGVKNVDTTGFDSYLNFQEKYVDLDASVTTPATTDTLTFTYTYDIPVLVAVENTASIATYGQREFAIFDKSINTQQAGRDRATAELTDYALSVIEGSFSTMTAGFKSGQYVTVTRSDFGINAQYLVQKVETQSLGAGLFQYTVSLASVKTIGMIRFLIQLLEANKNLIELNSAEVVDNLFSVTDSLNADSLYDALTIDSQGAYFTWASDSLESTQTRLRWDLSEWM